MMPAYSETTMITTIIYIYIVRICIYIVATIAITILYNDHNCDNEPHFSGFWDPWWIIVSDGISILHIYNIHVIYSVPTFQLFWYLHRYSLP